MGFFDKLKEGAQKLGNKISSGFQKLGGKKKETSTSYVDVFDDIYDILLDNDASYDEWVDAYEASKDLNLEKRDPCYYYLLEMLALWREVPCDYDYDPGLGVAMACAFYGAYMAGGEKDDVLDMIYEIDEELPDLTAAVYLMISETEDRDTLDLLYQAAAELDGLGTEQSYHKASMTIDLALMVNEQEGGDTQEMNERALRALQDQCDKHTIQF